MISKENNRFFYGWVVAAALFLIAFLPMTFVNTFFSYYQAPIVADFGITDAQFNIANTCSSLGAMLFSLSLSTRITKGNLRLFMAMGGTISAAAYFMLGRTTAVWQIYVLVFLAVFFISAITYVPINFLISSWFIDKKGLVTSIVFAGTGVGGICFSALESNIIADYGWRTGFSVTAAIVLVIAILAAVLVKKTPAEIGQKPYTSNSSGTKQARGASFAAAGGLTKAEAVKSGSFWFYCISMLMIGAASAGIITQLAAYLIYGGYQEQYASVYQVVSASMIIGKLILGPIVDKLGIIKGMFFACLCGIAGLIVLMLVPGTGIAPAYIAAVLIPVGTSLASIGPPLITASLFGYKDFGGIYGLGNTAFMVGCMVGPVVSGGIYTATGSYAAAWVLYCVVFAITFFSSFAATKIKKVASE